MIRIDIEFGVKMKDIERMKRGCILFAILFFITLGALIFATSPIFKEEPEFLRPSRWLSNENASIYTDYYNGDLNVRVDLLNANFSYSIIYADNASVNYTGSMKPTIFGGQQVIFLNITNKDLIMPGDIIGFKKEQLENPIVHRVIEKEYVTYNNTYEPVFKTKGDNNNKNDPWIIYSKDIIGVVVGIFF